MTLITSSENTKTNLKLNLIRNVEQVSLTEDPDDWLLCTTQQGQKVPKGLSDSLEEDLEQSVRITTKILPLQHHKIPTQTSCLLFTNVLYSHNVVHDDTDDVDDSGRGGGLDRGGGGLCSPGSHRQNWLDDGDEPPRPSWPGLEAANVCVLGSPDTILGLEPTALVRLH